MANRFRFQGQAIGVAARFHTPFQEVVDAQASVALAPIGGYGSARVTNFRYRDLLSFDSAESVVTGSLVEDEGKPPVNTTLISSTVDGFNLMGMVTIDRMVVHVVSTHGNQPDGQPSVRLLGTRFENLKIAGISVGVDLALDLFDRCDTHTKFLNAYRNEKDTRGFVANVACKDRLKNVPVEVQRWLPQAPQNDAELPATQGTTSLSLVRQLEPASAGLMHYGHIVYIEGFGVIRLGEVHITPYTRSVTMLHFNLGCPVGGDGSGGSGEDGGTGW